MKNYLFVLLALSASAHAGSVYRCGQNYSDRPCGNGAVVVSSTPNPAPRESVRVGMTEEALRQHFAESGFERVNVTETVAGVEKQFVVNARMGYYVYTRNGVVTAVQW
ncbi:MAG: DUF4124 domain-containing protein [Burkholderiaceae bacterium]